MAETDPALFTLRAELKGCTTTDHTAQLKELMGLILSLGALPAGVKIPPTLLEWIKCEIAKL
jgi:hypothetical protein